MMSVKQFKEQEYNTKSLDRRLWKKIFALMQPQMKDMKWMLLLNCVLALLDVFFPYMEKIGIDYFVSTDYQNKDLILFSVIFLAGILLSAFLVYHLFRLAGRIEMGFSYHVRQQAFSHLQVLSFSYYDKTPIGWLMARVTSDIARVAEILGWSFMDLAWGAVMMVGVSIVMLATNWKLALLVLIFTPLLAFMSMWFQKRMLKDYREVRKINSQITSCFNECISGAKTTKTLGVEEESYNQFHTETSSIREASIKAATLSAVFMPLIMGVSAVTNALLLDFGGREVLFGTLQFGTLMMFTVYATQFYQPLKQIASLIAEMQMAQANAERIISLLETAPEVQDRPEVIDKYGTEIEPKTQNYETLHGDIVFDHVNFYYNKEEPVLKDFNLCVKQGQTIALVGETGSGKSTIVNLLCRFYEPVSGKILIDGRDVRERSLGWLHSNLGYIMQSPHLFSGTVKENVRFGKLDATDEEVERACRLVNAHEFIMKLEKGYDNEVGEGGSLLSTGQKQLLSFARAVIADPRLFVLDEATASIDTETEKLIQDTIEKVLQGRTSFIVAHRLSTIVNADLILVIRNGEIQEQGSHSQLMREKGYYYRLYTNQFILEKQQQILNGQQAAEE